MMEMRCGLGLARRPVREPRGNETALRPPRDIAQIKYFQESNSMARYL
jgi:hypothetical protein